MCGIAVTLPPRPRELNAMLDRMAERGPDEAGTAHLAAASVGVVRLAITDVRHGGQPVLAPAGAVGLNGAIYNAPELTSRWGLRPATGNDAEVIWPLYERLGLRFADELEGMYAIAIVDDHRSRVVLAVDPVGIKPLYLAVEDGGWYAASTVQALPSHLRRTAFRVPPGTVMSSDGHTVRVASRPAPAGSLGAVLTEAVTAQIPAEVDWACMLSGGLDSSVLTALAARARPGPTTISVGLRGSADLEAAAAVAAVLGTRHHEVTVDEAELPGLVDAVIRATGSPDCSTVMGGVGTYVAARAARQLGCKVVLSGEGADELFAGYEEYRSTPPGLLPRELEADLADLASTECLRLDRCSMAHGIEARVPFLSGPVVAYARALPMPGKLDLTLPAEPRDKVDLRRLGDELLPAEIAWRPKTGFSSGSGLMAAGERLAERLVTRRGLALAASLPGWREFLRTQLLIGADERLAALTFSRWSELYGNEFGPWSELHARGRTRRFLSDGPYQPPQAAVAPTGEPGAAPSRSAALVLVSRLHADHPYGKWLAGWPGPLLAVTPAAVPVSEADYAHVARCATWTEADVLKQALMLDRVYGVGAVVSLGEVDVLPAARVRAALNLPGQQPDSAVAYRDKLVMRTAAAAGGVRVPAFAAAGSSDDVARFARAHPGPVIVKPRRGGGSVGVTRVEGLVEAASLELSGHPDGYVVEEFVDGPLFHVDAVQVAGQVVVAVACAYTDGGCLAHWQDAANGSWTLAPGNPVRARLEAATARLLAALPGPADLAVHAEFFLASGGEPVLCEVASRCGGIPIPSMLVRYLGADLRQLWARVQCGLPVDWQTVQRRARSQHLVANIGLPWRDGRVTSVPAEPPAGVQNLVLSVAPGDDFSGGRYAARRSGDFAATWLVTAESEPQLKEAIRTTVRLMEGELRWDVAEVGHEERKPQSAPTQA